MKIVLLLLTGVAGVAAAAQSAANGALAGRAGLGTAMITNSVVVLFGSVIAFFATGSHRTAGASLSAPLHYFIGGFCGFFIVGTMAIAVPKVGAALALALMVLGQGVMALVIDHFGMFELDAKPVTVVRLLGVGCLVGGVVLLRR